MHFDVIGGGPAGLYFAYLMKKSFPHYHIRVVEQNAADVTFGLGVVLSDRALNFVAEADKTIIARLQRHMEKWSDQHIVHRGQCVVVDGSSFSAIERLLLLAELQLLCAQVDVDLQFGVRVDRSNRYASADVVVGADGANSAVRAAHATAFGTEVVDLRNYFAWYGVRHRYAAHTISFETGDDGVFCGHHYRYKPNMSTFVAEVDTKTWKRSGMASMDDEGRRELIERIFVKTLAGYPLVTNRSVWRRWRIVKNKRWFHKNTVLIGDALRTAHPSIGSGTRLAMEDAIALWRAFRVEGTSTTAAFERYVSERKPIRDKLDHAAELSVAWYEDMAAKMALTPHDLALDYLLRTNVITVEQIARSSPIFWQRCSSLLAT